MTGLSGRDETLCGPDERIGMDDEGKHAAEVWALANDDNLLNLLAWRLVKQRAENGGFNGLLASDLTKARRAIADLLDDGE